MNLHDLQALAAYHTSMANASREIALRMVPGPARLGMLHNANEHTHWARGLGELAASFADLGAPAPAPEGEPNERVVLFPCPRRGA